MMARSARGFTLIEILVVVVIVGVLAAALTIAVAGGSERQLSNTAEQFQALLGQACSEAELSGREVGVVLAADGYAFRRLDGTTWRDFERDNALRERHWPAGLRFDATRDGRPLEPASAVRSAPQLVCFSSGELTPFALTLALGDASVRYRIRGGDDGSLQTDRLEAMQ
jgi:general secretion pathway protein H